jgi:hypothetical protein
MIRPRRHQTHVMAEFAQPARQMMGAARCRPADPRRRRIGQPGDQLAASRRLATSRPHPPMAATSHAVLPRSIPAVLICIGSCPASFTSSAKGLPRPAGADHPVTRRGERPPESERWIRDPQVPNIGGFRSRRTDFDAAENPNEPDGAGSMIEADARHLFFVGCPSMSLGYRAAPG